MEKLKMHTPDLAEENYKKLAALFPNAVTETIDDDGNVVRAIDKDVLMQEINTKVVDDGQERYQFTWPDKRKSIVLANQAIAKTLRIDRKKTVSRDGTLGGDINSENIYIEGDNLDALKILRETYLGKVKMIYIDPPYNTGNDFIYEDDFSQQVDTYIKNSGQIDENGNRLVQNNESNGRFHTDWLNMIYPRLLLARDFLSDDGIIFISIDENENINLCKLCDEIFGSRNKIGEFIRKTKSMTGDEEHGFDLQHDYIIAYSKKSSNAKLIGEEKKFQAYSNPDNDPKGDWCLADPSAKSGGNSTYFGIENPYTHKITYPPVGRYWAFSKKTLAEYVKSGRIVFKQNYGENERGFIFKRYKSSLKNNFEPVHSLTFAQNDYMNSTATTELKTLFQASVFSYPKPKLLLKKLIEYTQPDLVMDFFSGSATTAEAVIEANQQDNRNIKFILIQLPERVEEKNSLKFETICDIGEERIRRAGKKIKKETGADIDYGFRCFKIDSSNMKDVYYKPAEVKQAEIDLFADNIKADRTPEDLLIQVMLDLGVLLSSKVERIEIAGKKVFSVADGYLIACFDDEVTEEVVTAIAKKKPFYAVFRDSSMADDSVAANFEQIFATYSPQTVRKVL